MNASAPAETCQFIVEHMSDALVYSDPDGIIRGWNGGAEALFGFPRAEALGQNLDLIIPERLREAHWQGFERAMASGKTRYGRRSSITRALTRGGEAIYVDMSFAVVADADGKTIGSVAVARDATQRYREERALREELAALRKAGPGSA